MKNTWLILVGIMIVCSSPLMKRLSAQQEGAPLPIEAALEMRSFESRSPLALSPDGRFVAYTLLNLLRKETQLAAKDLYFTRTGVPVDYQGADIWLTDVSSGKSQNLTLGQGSSWGPAWSPDGGALAFYSDRNGQARLWLWERSTGSLREVSQVVVRPFMGYQIPRWTLDGRKLLTKVLPEGLTIAGAADLFAPPSETRGSESGKPTVVVYSSAAKPENKMEAAAPRPVPLPRNIRIFSDLALIDVSSGRVQRLASGYLPLMYWLSPDGQRVALSSAKAFASADSQQVLFDLVVIALSNGRAQVVATDVRLAGPGCNVSWSPDGKYLSYLEAGPQAKGDLFIIPASGGAARRLTLGPHPNFGDLYRAPLWDTQAQAIYLLSSQALWKASLADSAAREFSKIQGRRLTGIVSSQREGRIWSPDGGLVLMTRDDESKQEGFYQVDLLTGKHTRLLEESKSYGNSFQVSAHGQQIIFIAQSAHQAPDIWMADAKLSNSKPLTHINPQFDRYLLGKSRVIEWLSGDGEKLRGALLLPAGFQAGRSYPLIVYPYGGASRSDTANRFGLQGTASENMHLLSTRGYAVLLPDAPLRPGTPVLDLAKTVLPGVNKAIEIGVADPDRLGLMGHSYGGYSALALLVQTTRFKAAVVKAGLSNLISMYGEMKPDGSTDGPGYLEGGQGGMGATLWEHRERYIENSPVFYLDRVRTPLLVINGSFDTASTPTQPEQVFVGLRRLGQEVTYVQYLGEGHSIPEWGYANQVDYCERIIAWFDQHLKRTVKAGQEK